MLGCGQGQHVGRMRELGFDVSGIDVSPAQVELAGPEARLTRPGASRVGDPDIPRSDAAYDFVYVVNVLHHLESIDDQRRAVGELLRVLRPGGTLFIHEINTRNILFRFYMGYVCSVTELHRRRRGALAAAPSGCTRTPTRRSNRFATSLSCRNSCRRAIVRLLTPIERVLEGSPLRVFSAHYLAVLRKA